MNHLIAPSILSADFLNLQNEIEMLNNSQADLIHIDVMDGHFVPNITIGPPVIAKIRKVSAKPLDVHLMIDTPERYFEDFCEAGADYLSVHFENSLHLHRSVSRIKALGMKAGVVLNPHTPVSFLFNILPYVDMVMLMSVNPGFGGQKFIETTLGKISGLKQMLINQNLNVLIEVDGGITLENAPAIINAGADILVAGNTVFASADPMDTIRQLKNC